MRDFAFYPEAQPASRAGRMIYGHRPWYYSRWRVAGVIVLFALSGVLVVLMADMAAEAMVLEGGLR